MNSYLIRYGAVPEVVRCTAETVLERGTAVVLQTARGLQMGVVLERERFAPDDELLPIERIATHVDLSIAAELQSDCDAEFARWCDRIEDWDLALELVDLEWTLDRQKLILYVLTERGPDSTKLALQAAAAGLGIVEVQPIAREGLVAAEAHGCGSGGCGCGH